MFIRIFFYLAILADVLLARITATSGIYFPKYFDMGVETLSGKGNRYSAASPSQTILSRF